LRYLQTIAHPEERGILTKTLSNHLGANEAQDNTHSWLLHLQKYTDAMSVSDVHALMEDYIFYLLNDLEYTSLTAQITTWACELIAGLRQKHVEYWRVTNY
jgi:hypothetical protein